MNAPVHSAAVEASFDTARVPAVGTSGYVIPSTSIGVAVVDSGVAAHTDLNVASRVVLADARNALWSNYRDDFWNIAYDGSDGTDNWQAKPWIERGDDGSPNTGAITVETDYCPNYWDQCLEMDARGAVNLSIEREFDLSAATSAAVGFDYRLDDKSESVQFVIEASRDGGLTWSGALGIVSDNTVDYAWIDLTPYISANTRIRFRLTDSDPDAHFYVDALEVAYKVTRPALDQFNVVSYTNNNGSEAWTGGWTETGDNQSASNGSITVEADANCPYTWSGNRCVEFDAAGGVGDSITREINLGSAFSAVLSFDYRLKNTSSYAEYVVEVSSNAGLTWTTLDWLNWDTVGYGMSYDLTPYRSANTRIRFRVTDSDPSAQLWLDDVTVDVDRGDVNDRMGHGTHVAGIIGGTATSSLGSFPGVAPASRFMTFACSTAAAVATSGMCSPASTGCSRTAMRAASAS